jgi:hypothetical protein
MLTPHRCKQISLLAAVALTAGSGVRADIIDTIQAATFGQTVYVSGTYSVNRPCYVPGGVRVVGPATFNFNNAANGFVPNGNNVRLDQISVTGVNNPGIYIYNKSGCIINSPPTARMPTASPASSARAPATCSRTAKPPATPMTAGISGRPARR